MEKTRLFKIQEMLFEEIDKYDKILEERDYPSSWEKIHVVSCASIGMEMAKKQNVDPQMVGIACAIHDYGRIVTGKQKDHAEVGYELLKEFLVKTDMFNKEEIELLVNSSRNHSSKSEIGNSIEEIVKDADVIDFYNYGYDFAREEQKKRYLKYYTID